MYRLSLLGGINLEGASGPLSGRIVQRRQLAVLALLASASGSAPTREKMVGLLWGGSPEDRARARLSDSLYLIRQGLGEDAIVTEANRIRLNEELVQSDVTAFDRAIEAGRWQEAVEVYGGPFLDGFHLGGEGAFERWVDEERRRLASRYHQALEKLAESAEAQGDWSQAVARWKDRAGEEPTNSRVTIRLMKAQAAAGNVPGALEHARVHELLLREELDLPVPDEVRELSNELAEGETTADAAALEPAAPADGDAAPTAGAEGDGRTVSNKQPRPTSVPSGSKDPAGGRRAIRGLGCVLAVFAVLGAGWYLAVGDRGEGAAGVAASGDARPVIVVLPFENLGRPKDEYFAEGMTEELTARLASVPHLGVIARTSALQYRDTAMDVREIGEELGAAYVLEGTVRWEHRPDDDSRVRVTAQLVRTSDGTHLWADSYDRALSEIFSVQTYIAERVVQALGLTLGGHEEDALAREPTGHLDAYDHFLQGRSYLARQFSEDAARAAINQYERAVELDPGFAEAWRRLIHARLWLTWVFGDEEAGLRARADLERLLELDREDPEVRLGRAWYLYYGERRYEEAYREVEAVQENRPGDAEATRLTGLLQTHLDRWDQALATQKEALELNPRDAGLAFSIGQALRYQGRYEEALDYYERAFSLAPEEDLTLTYSAIEHVHLALGDTLRAREAREHAREIGANAWFGGRAELYRGDLEEATERIRAQPATSPVARRYRYDNLADAYGRLDHDELRNVYADSLLQLASAAAPEDWAQPRNQTASLAWVHSGLALIHLEEVERGLDHVRRGLELEAPFEDALIGPFASNLAARAFVRAGREEEAIDLVEAARSLPGALSLYELRHDPEWDPLRGHPRFERLLDTSG